MSSRESSTSQRRLEAVERERQALELRKAGASYAQIATAIGYAGPSSGYRAVMAAIRKTLQEPADEVRKLELARLDEMLRAMWPGILRGDTKSVMAGLKVMERRAFMLGLDAPIRIDIAGEIRRAAVEAGLNDEDADAAVREAMVVVREAHV